MADKRQEIKAAKHLVEKNIKKTIDELNAVKNIETEKRNIISAKEKKFYDLLDKTNNVFEVETNKKFENSTLSKLNQMLEIAMVKGDQSEIKKILQKIYETTD